MHKNELQIINTARELLKLYGYYIEHLWHVRDVHSICEQNNIAPITDKEALEVFLIASQQVDEKNGISLQKLETALQLYLKNKAPDTSVPQSVEVEAV